MNRRWLVACAVLAAAPAGILACSDDPAPAADPVTPGGSDASIDRAAPPTGSDAGKSDATAPAVDAAVDAARDTGADAGLDTGAADAGTDSGSDADAVDAAGDGAVAFVPPNIDGNIGATEYGAPVDGTNQQTIVQDKTRTWYMTWDETYLYVAVKQVGGYDPIVLEIDTDGVASAGDAGATDAGAPVDAGAADADAGAPVDAGAADAATAALDGAVDASDAGAPSPGTRVLLPNYDSTNGTTTLDADFVLYWKNDYDEYRTSVSPTAWSDQLPSRQNTLGNDKQSYYDSSNQIDYREARIPWTTIRAGGRPASFKWLGYAVGNKRVYGQMPPTNNGGNAFEADDAGATTAAFTTVYAVGDATPVTGTKPFAVVSP